MNLNDIQSFVQLGSNGLVTATFTQIRDALTERYREIYGVDIDLSTGSVDGIFVNDLALIINNILQSMAKLYNNLDVDKASGVYLTNLCKLSNVYRKDGSYSWTWLSVTNTGTYDLENVTNLVFLDKSGIEWTCPDTVTIPADGSTVPMKVICNEYGPIEAPVGWIDKTVELLPVKVEQRIAAKTGQFEETDVALKVRRSRYANANSVTVLNALNSSLLNVIGIEDVKIYNNNTDTNMTANDTTTIEPHSIYIILKTDPTYIIKDEDIGNQIHNKLTPGIKTCISATEDIGGEDVTIGGVQHSYDYEDYVYGVSIVENAQTVYWKVAAQDSPELTITIYPTSTFLGYEEIKTISKSLYDSLNQKEIGETLHMLDVTQALLYADPRYGGRSTYNTIEIEVDGNFPYVPQDTYFDYNDFVCGSDEEGTWDGTTGHGTDADDNEIWVFKLIHS